MPTDIHYFIASLPGLKRHEKPFYSFQEFLKLCEYNFALEVANAVASLSLDPVDAKNDFCDAAKEWRQWTVFAKDCLAKLRAAKLKRNPDTIAKHDEYADLYDKRELEKAFAIESPSERQAAIENAMWKFLDEYLAVKYPFSLDAVAAYGLRLLLAERELSRGFDKGLDVFNSMVSNAIETADNTRM